MNVLILKNIGIRMILNFKKIQSFNQFHGVWEVMVIPGNDGAYQFWQATVSQYTDNQYMEYKKHVKHLDNSVKNIFCFRSRSES